jgi:medium-chain acyl-[acyl-carrier-protein] hydrolase
MRWQDHLPMDIEVWALEYPGHESRYREPLVASATELAAQISKQIVKVVKGPFALFGHSMGSLIAYETLKLLKRDYDLEPKTLFVSGFSAPQLPPFRPPLRDLPEADFRKEIAKYGGTPAEILADEEFMQFVSPLLRNDMGLCEIYEFDRGHPINVPIVAFGGYNDPIVPWHRLLAWSERTAERFEAFLLPGEHFFIRAAAPEITAEISSSCNESQNTQRLKAPSMNVVDLWLIKTYQPRSVIASLSLLLSSEEVRLADAYAQTADRTRSIVSRAALRDLLSRYIGIDAKEISFTLSESAKPICLRAKPLSFNVSHSDEYAIIGISLDQDVGVDIEMIKEDIETVELATLFASLSERQHLASVDEADRIDLFYDLWVRKEACLKCTGVGFLGAPLLLEVGFNEYSVVDPKDHGFFGLQSFSPVSGYAAAIATKRSIDSCRVRLWSPPV